MSKTRNAKKCAISEFLGSGGKEFSPSELPTLKDILLKGLLLKEREEGGNKHVYSIKKLAQDILPALKDQLLKANAQFVVSFTVVDKAILDRIERAWCTGRDIGLRKVTKKAAIEQFTSRLNKLFDLCKCQCSILYCKEMEEELCGGCSNQIHINCTCTRDHKILY